MAGPSIEAIHLTKRYGAFVALSDLNLKVEGVKCVGFLGPNGAGKTTTLKLFTDMIFPTTGEARINGHNVHEEKRIALDACGVLIETPEIYPYLTPREALTMISELRGIPSAERPKRVKDVLEVVSMTEWIDKRTGEFSKGMKQRVNVAATLLDDPEIILLDEPTTGLDPRGMSEVREIVRTLKRRDKLIFMSSHLLAEVSDVCDEVAMIDRGRLLVYDSIETVTARASGGPVVVEVGFNRTVDEALVATVGQVPGVLHAERSEASAVRLQLAAGDNVPEQVLVELVRSDLHVNRYQPSTSALEDAYLSLIKDSR